MAIKRSRLLYFLLIVGTIGIGLASRSSFIPKVIYPYLGDALYTLMFYWVFGFLFPKASSIRVACLAIGTCFLIEFSQFYQADWINKVRSYRLGGSSWAIASCGVI